ncbi:MAG: glyoxalase [Flavobacteriaceae bacterium CG_4_8_14_3_um_filter_34_10]|nr:VOC family protein [Flavobacteriia bacterium]PIQ17288.1 MAG: glyoxalase [Flavobacteriaceae bacterium CG18_big_fil_WC_8_21_14_2_50_34_36]PIV50947.1 MAG: glyoxalase [Flavobacteriaceae bacterium CG02_land_8_20_14_3_00_34_13]PIX09537.1 MAG: glyoxalase [Flavobacteriaceae bacterium CG_4_8_14_3_um_filter_34_10]PIZ06826.1 MAG: glyoxalase [Flavobacteriaceae bacterium CG_4_10_14_0_8_um_filter_34_31]PJC06352.1 MAG: glyoxalase [Flavobacteriaceae bacterium CG_4_9_14_0_8_um_filter_34_30]
MKKAIILLILIQFSNVVIGQGKDDISLSFNHIALSVKDINVSAEFYTTVLNLKIIPLNTNRNDVKWISLGDGKELHLLSFVEGDIKTNKAIHLALSTANFDAFVQKLTDRKVAYSDFPGNLNKINVRPDGIRQVFFQDPDSYWIEVNSIKE